MGGGLGGKPDAPARFGWYSSGGSGEDGPTLKEMMTKAFQALILLVATAAAQESDFKEVKEPEKQEEPAKPPLPAKQEESESPAKARKEQGKVVSPQTDYPVRNIGKADPRFAALHKELVALQPALTLDSLYSRLLAGETFRLERPDKPAVCKGCNGFGKIPDKGSSYRTKDGKLECPDCKGLGKIDSVRVILIKW